MNDYKIIEHIGDGAHGHVLKGYSIKSKEEVALKRIHFKKHDNEIPVAVLREIKILLLVKSKYVSTYQYFVLNKIVEFKCRNSGQRTIFSLRLFQIVELQDYFSHDCSVVLVFEFMPSGLWEVLHDSNNPPAIAHIKSYMRMLLKGVAYLHEKSIMHRVRFINFLRVTLASVRILFIFLSRS